MPALSAGEAGDPDTRQVDSGKTTLVKELVKAGATYYSDEYAVLGGDGRVSAFGALSSLSTK
jgi:hypothetical protein